ncbi:sodium-translocating pyrophosphatase [candidate division KSB1 bacterium]
MIVVPFIAGFVALVIVGLQVKYVLSKDAGTDRMKEISGLVQDGAKTFLHREYLYVFSFVAVIVVLLAITPLINPQVTLSWKTSVAFLLGAVVSAACGYIGMSMATRSNARTAQGAVTGGVKEALSVAIAGGSVMGFSVVGLGLLGLVSVFVVFGRDPVIVNGYAMGASLVALFARSGGGIFTKGADMGADLVGKVEAGIPEDDPRNPAVIADNVGDNVGDVAGLGADLLESYVEAIIAALAIASTLGVVQAELQMLPLLIASAGIVSSIVGIYYVKVFGRRNPQSALMWGTYVAAGLTAVFTYFIVDNFGVAYGEYGKLGPFWATIAGVVSGIAVGFTSEYFTSSKYKPVKNLAEASQTGPAITVTEGIAVGMQSTGIPVLVLAVAILVSFEVAGALGVAMAAFGMLATTGMIVAVDSYGPIADNAGGIAEMAELDPEIRKITDNLDAVGNTTAAIGKGFAIGSAAFVAMSLVTAYLAVSNVSQSDIRNPNVLAGLIIGGMLPFVFSSMLFRAVGRVAYKMIEEVRRQFRDIPGLMEGKVLPDSSTCVRISTDGAIKGMLVPGSMAILVPVVVGFFFGADTLAGLLVGALITGLMLGIQTANSGGALDNAKKYIEEGHFGGKGSATHAAAIVGDTVGDPLKDTVGPSINILIKLMAVISLVLAPLFG